jgi:DNA replication and repair protein RecF
LVLKRLSLKSFRNYDALEVLPAPGVNVFFGSNAQGKTNILEAIFLLARGYSMRADKDVELVRWGAPEFHARGEFIEEQREISIEVAFSPDKGKSVKVNGLSKRASQGLVPEIKAVLFVPDDLQMVKGPASLRRRFIDQEISQVNPSYAHDLARYQKALAQRNVLLRTGTPMNDPTLHAFTEQLVVHGTQVYKKRLVALRRLARVARDVHARLADGESLEVNYRPSVPISGNETDDDIRSAFFDRLKERAPAEAERGQSLVGPHRDDILFLVCGADARLFGSQGQQRSVVVSLKVSELEYIKQETGVYPLLLLDDILSELDVNRRHGLIGAVIDGVQLFLTCTDYSPFLSDLPERTRYFRVASGGVEMLNDG